MAFTVLTLEVVLIRVFDFILTPNLGYLIISSAMFCLGLAGVYEATRESDANAGIAHLPVLFGLAVCVMRPGLNWLPFDIDRIFQEPILQLASIFGMFILLGLPFFFAGLFFSRVFSLYPNRIGFLYCWDLLGAAFGAFVFLAVFSAIGPGGVLLCATATSFFAAALLIDSRSGATALFAMAIVVGCVPFVISNASFDFVQHQEKGTHIVGGVKHAQQAGSIERTIWDPVSRIDVLAGPRGKEVAYDGGTQSTTIFPFDGDYRRLRSEMPGSVLPNFWNRGVFASHYLMRNTEARVLVIGAGAGQEVKAALMFGASRVDAVEMVESVLELSLEQYSSYNGGLFLDQRVNPVHGEGRAFVRANDQFYDIIQIYSNHTVSSIASGTGAADISYLLTVEAFIDYFKHLSDGGILQINHPIYPRLVTTAAKAWKELGRTDFRKHVAIWERDPDLLFDTKPTFLVKMTPWSPEEMGDMKSFFSAKGDETVPWVVAENPIQSETSFLPAKFFSGNDEFLPRDTVYRVVSATDDCPFFKFIRKKFGKVSANQATGLNNATATWLNRQLRHSIPMDVIHIFLLAGLSVVIAAFSLSILLYRRDRSQAWSGRGFIVTYFSLLGLGFIIIEVVLIQKFMKIIGYPVYTFSVVIFALLFSAGLGSFFSSRLKPHTNQAGAWPFVLIIVFGAALLLGFNAFSDLLMRTPIAVRLVATFLLLAPLGFFLGMPFPLGIRVIEHQGRQAIAWAWGMNGLATVVGSLLASVCSIIFGFNVTLTCACLCYAGALLAFRHIGNKPWFTPL